MFIWYVVFSVLLGRFAIGGTRPDGLASSAAGYRVQHQVAAVFNDLGQGLCIDVKIHVRLRSIKEKLLKYNLGCLAAHEIGIKIVIIISQGGAMADRQKLLDELKACEKELAEAQGAMPYHSARPWQYERLEQAEEAVAQAKARLLEFDNKED